ncbi:hypothetical protein F5Y16DRAFT_399983 [Xylariaceae sp. FL0255]|nr:hypothetical protein F5Y16DRAFT_399983 [Xylariaceae sp. FL0255]
MEQNIATNPHANPNSPSTPEQHAYHSSMMPPPEDHETWYNRVLKKREVPFPKRFEQFYTSDEDGTASHFASIALIQTKYPNANIHRVFDTLTNLQMNFLESQISCAFDDLIRLDEEEAKNTPAKQAQQPFPFDRESFLSRCRRSPDQSSLCGVLADPFHDTSTGTNAVTRSSEGDDTLVINYGAIRENLFSNIYLLTSKLHHLASWQETKAKIPRVTRNHHFNLFNNIAAPFKKAEKPAITYFRAFDDVCLFGTDPLIAHLQYPLSEAGDWVKELINKLFPSVPVVDPESGESNQQRYVCVSSWRIFCSGLVLGPLGILDLVSSSKPISFAVVAVFIVTFAGALLPFEPRTGYFVVSVTAYAALLGAFLSNSMSNIGSVNATKTS